MNAGNKQNDFNRWLDEKLGLEEKRSQISLSGDFDQSFWKKVDAHRSQDWLGHVLEQMRWEITFPNLTQAVAVLLIAGSVGAFGGVYSASKDNVSIQTLSGFVERNGIPSNSVAGAYFRTDGEEIG